MDLDIGELEVLSEIPWASNFTFMARIRAGSTETLVVYKPRRGEAPLWDFPAGTLCNREVAAFMVSEAAGWGFVPPTVLRDGPLGPGAVQLFVDHDPNTTAFDLIEANRPLLRQIALFDLIVNNADRKAGHVLLSNDDGRVWAVDHGICFHAEPKLRTVLWDFVGEALTKEEREAAGRTARAAAGRLAADLRGLLKPEEIGALAGRAERFSRAEAFPAPGPGRHYPWPAV